MTADKKIPALRFSEFEGEWEEKKVIDIAPLQRGFDLPVDKIVEGNYPVVFSNGILKFHNVSMVKSPGVVTGRSGTIGKVTFVDKDFWPHNTSLWVTDFIGNDERFIYYFYSTLKLQNFSTGSGVPTLNRNNVHKHKTHIPAKKEQQKIASFLTAVDDKIQQLTKKKALLEQYKKGVMQQIFSQHIRFKDDDGNDYPDWDEKSLKDLSSRIGDGIHATPQYDDNGEYFFINGNNLNEGKIILSETTKRVSNTEYDIHKRDLNERTILLSINGTIGNIAFYNNEKVVLGKSACYINLLNDIGINFIYYFLNTNQTKSYFISELTGTTIRNLSLTSVKNTLVTLPTKDEQQKIANFLTSIDDKIDAVNKQLEQTQQYKKGLLQQMFV